MDKINALGQELLKRKEDLITYKNQDRIHEALIFSAEEQLVKPKMIDDMAKEMLFNSEIDVTTFRNYLLATVQFLKSEAELMEDFKAIKELLNKELVKQELDYVVTDFNIKEDRISVLRTYIIDSKFVMDHFDISEDKVDSLMQRDGFVSKYAVLRLPKIIKDFIENYDDKPYFFNMQASNVFEYKDPKGYSIDLEFDIRTDEFKNEINIEHIVSYIKDVIQDCDEYFEKRMSV